MERLLKGMTKCTLQFLYRWKIEALRLLTFDTLTIQKKKQARNSIKWLCQYHFQLSIIFFATLNMTSFSIQVRWPEFYRKEAGVEGRFRTAFSKDTISRREVNPTFVIFICCPEGEIVTPLQKYSTSFKSNFDNCPAT